MRRDWASMTAAVAEGNPQGRVRRDWARMTAAVAQDIYIIIHHAVGMPFLSGVAVRCLELLGGMGGMVAGCGW